MDREITDVHSLLGKITDAPEEPGRREIKQVDNVYGLQNPAWGPQASVEAGDAATRTGIDMGQPASKAASLRHALLFEEQASLEKIAAGRVGAVLGVGKRILQGGAKLLGMGGSAVNKGSKASAGWFAKRRAARTTADAAARATKATEHATAQARRSGVDKAIHGAAYKGKELIGKAPVKPLAAAGGIMTAHDLRDSSKVMRGQRAGRMGNAR
jgi:hypothetical protein